MATPFFVMSDRNPGHGQPGPRPGPNPPKPRGRKSKAQKVDPKKQPQRGMGVAQLERLLRQQQNNHIHHDHDHQQHDGRVNPEQQPGLAHYGFPVHGVGSIRVLEGSCHELPSMPNIEPPHGYNNNNNDNMLYHSTTAASLSFKKKRVIGDEVGFVKEKDKYAADQIFVTSNNGYNFAPGFDHHNHAGTTGGFNGYDYLSGTEVVAVHKKGNGSGNVMMEYGFFPGIQQQNEGLRINKSCIMTQDNYYHHNNNNNYYDRNQMTDLNLKMGCSDSSASASASASASPSSSLSSLTTATTQSGTASRTTATATAAAASNTCSIDLSLKLSY